LPKAQRDGKTAHHSARFYALCAAKCADGSRPIPTNIPETGFFDTLHPPGKALGPSKIFLSNSAKGTKSNKSVIYG
jgi:hypothetical protein